ncbi:MAG: tetratricopeptide repeat protein [Vitreoscilla sp.]|nr:tetratricopeptide repeat protein [Burkholderiales bacterium]
MSTLNTDAFADWEARVAATWKIADTLTPGELVRTIDTLCSERPADDPFAQFERACARDTAGIEGEAEPLYRAALASGALDPYRHARASIQLGSTLKHLGRLDDSERLLLAQLARCQAEGPGAALFDEVRAVLAFTWIAQGRTLEAAAIALETLAPHLSRYNRSMAANARALRPATPA